jgi:hypothetical protein
MILLRPLLIGGPSLGCPRIYPPAAVRRVPYEVGHLVLGGYGTSPWLQKPHFGGVVISGARAWICRPCSCQRRPCDERLTEARLPSSGICTGAAKLKDESAARCFSRPQSRSWIEIPETAQAADESEAGERLGAGVDLDPWKDALGRDCLYQRRAAGALLTDRFVIHDDAADELGGARGGK